MIRTIPLTIFAIFLQKSISTPLLFTTESFILASEIKGQSRKITNQSENIIKQPPTIIEMNFNTNISNRFSTTLVTSKLKNQNSYATEATFFIIIPENAYISGFVMDIDGKSYKAYVKEKEEAKDIYNQAAQQGFVAAYFAASARYSNKFTVSLNIEAGSKAVFYLTYQELLVRAKGQYELILNINPGQIIKNLNIQVNINESRPITFVRSSLRSGEKIGKNNDKLDFLPDIVINNLTANVKFSPNLSKQKKYIEEFGSNKEYGLSAQFVVQYDVKRDPFGGEVLVQDGHFVHFFAPSDLPPLVKQIIFVLDTSFSMAGEKMAQLKEAMVKVFSELRPQDFFSIVEFNSNIKVWDIDTTNYSELVFGVNDLYCSLSSILKKKNIAPSVSASQENIRKAINIIKGLNTYGSTNMMGGLEVGLFLANKNLDRKLQPIIIFLTDGIPSTCVSKTNKIIELVTKINSGGNQVPIFSLSFGNQADREFLDKLSLKNAGFSRHIHEGADASLQFQEFYKLVSSPLLRNITFKYTDNAKEVTKKHHPLIFGGSELVVAGKTNDPKFTIGVDCFGSSGLINLTPVYEKPIETLEKLWAYLTIKQLLTEKKISNNNKTEITRKALDLALKYTFVTPITSLVVVKPNKTVTVNTEKANQPSIVDMETGMVLHQEFVNDYSFTKSPITMPPWVPLPWLHNIINPNGTLTIPNKGTFELGRYGDTMNYPKCPKNPLNTTIEGECRLIDDCLEIHSFLFDLQTIIKYYCPLNPYVGVCCPPREDYVDYNE